MILNFSKKITLLISIATAGLSVVEAKDFMNDTRARALMLASTIATPCAFAAAWNGQAHPLLVVGALGLQALTVYGAIEYSNSRKERATTGLKSMFGAVKEDLERCKQEIKAAQFTNKMAIAIGAITALEIAGLVYFAASKDPVLFQWWFHRILG